MRAAILLALALAAAGCGKGQSLVVVEVTTDAPLDGVATLAVQASDGAKMSSFSIAAPSGALSLGASGTSFGINLPDGMTGTLSVTVGAVDGNGNPLASGSGSAQIVPGKRVDLPLVLAVNGAGNDLGGGIVGDMASPADMAQPSDLALPPTGPMLGGDRMSQMFGSVTVGKMSNAVMIKLTNNGETATSALSYATSGTNLDQFTLTNGCTGTLTAGASCTVTAQFSPTTTGDKSAHFDVGATSGGTVGVDLAGTGTPQGTLSISADAPYNGSCGSAVIGQTSTTFATYTVKNVGTSTTGTMTVTTGDSQFVATGCAGTLDPNATCSITVHLKPTTGGSITSSVQVAATPGGTAPANVSGTGLNPAAFKITSASGFAFGSAQRNSAGNAFTFTATNSGDVTSNALAHTTITGANASSFILTSDGCYQQAIAAAGTCTFQVEFKPVVSGSLGATLHVNDGATSLGQANIAGTGTPLWQAETLPLPSGATAQGLVTTVFGVAGDGSHVYAAGGDNYYVRDATGTWTTYPVSAVGLTPSHMNGGAATATNDVYLATDVYLMRSTTPTSWSGVNEASNEIDSVWAFNDSDVWTVNDDGAIYHLTGGSWTVDTTLSGGALWGSGDGDLWLGGGVAVGSPATFTASVWHRATTGSWTQTLVGTGCVHCIGSVTPNIAALWGFGAPSTTVFGSMRPVEPVVWTSATNTWTDLANTPNGMGGSGKTCPGVWGSAPTAVWFACTGGMYLYTGGGTWDGNSTLDILGFVAVWGSGPNDVYAVGDDDDNNGFVYHYY